MACFPGQPKDSGPLSDPELDQDDLSILRPHSTQVTIEWLESNYHYQEGICLPRSSIYDHYLDFCTREQLQPVNAASFGKIIRQQFPSLTTRRLGTRGQSKYHYYGLGIRPNSRYYTEQYLQKQQTQGSTRKEPESKKLPHPYYVSKEKQGAVLPAFPDVKALTLSESINREKLHTFMVMYRAHCQRILDSVARANFSDVENFLLHFWQGMPTHLVSILPHKVVVDLVSMCDIMLYKVINNVLISSPLQNFPESLAQDVLKFSTTLKPWLDSAMKGLPDTLRDAKQNVAESFARNVKRQTSIMRIAQAARIILRAEDSLLQLRKDWNSLDLHSIFAHTLYAVRPLDVSQQYIEMVPGFVEEFAGLVQDKSSVEDFVLWIENILERCIRKPEDCDSVAMRKVGRMFLLTWKFFTSKIVREFTLQNAASFETFHLLHILIDDYIIHFLESTLDGLQERMYHEKIDVLLKQEDPVEDTQVEDHFSAPENPHDAVSDSTPTSIEDGADFSAIAQAVQFTFQPESHLSQQSNSTAAGSAVATFEGLPPISQETASVQIVAPMMPSSHIDVPCSLPSGGSLSNQPGIEAGGREDGSVGATSNLPLTVSEPIPLEVSASEPPSQLGRTFGTFAFPTVSTSRTTTLSHMQQVQSLSNQNLSLHAIPLQAINQTTAPLSAAAQTIQTAINPAQVVTSTTNMPNFPTAIQMPLTHPITNLPAPGNPTGIPLLPTMPSVYPYPYPASMPGAQNLPSQPITSTMFRVNAPGFPPQTLVPGYPSYVQPSLYGSTPQVNASNFSR